MSNSRCRGLPFFINVPEVELVWQGRWHGHADAVPLLGGLQIVLLAAVAADQVQVDFREVLLGLFADLVHLVGDGLRELLKILLLLF